MNIISETKTLTLLLLTVFFIGVGTSQPLEITPEALDENQTVYTEGNYSFNVSNTGDQQITDFELEQSSDWEWTSLPETIASGSTLPLNGSINISAQDFNESFTATYTYNNTEYSEEPVSVDIEAVHPETSYTVDVFETGFEQEFEESSRSVLRISNTGTETLYNASFTGEDLEFDKNHFNLSPGDEDIVEFTVDLERPPLDEATQATNTTYTRDLQFDSPSSTEFNEEIEVFIPYRDYTGNETELDLATDLDRLSTEIIDFCSDPEHENHLLCGGQITETVEVTEYIERTPEANVTLTEDEINEIKDGLGEDDELHEELEELRQQEQDTQQSIQELVSVLETMNEQTNQSLSQQEQTEQERLQAERRRTQFQIIVFLLGFIGVTVVGGGVALFKLVNSGGDKRLGANR